MRVDFPQWEPDKGGTDGAFLETCDNVQPTAKGFAPLPSFVAEPGTALPAYPLGGGSFVNKTRETTTFAGTATNLYRYIASGWTSVGSGFAATDDWSWQFQQFGQWIIASNGADAPQYFDLNASTNFAALTGDGGTSPPRMKMLAVVANFLVGGYVDGNAAKVQWAGINTATEWRPGYGQGNDQIFPDGGDVTAITSGEFGLVFQIDSIRRMTYVGGDLIFQFDVISPNIGCVHPRAFCQVGRLAFFLSARGFMMCDGSTVTPIGDQKVDATFFAARDSSYMGRMSCVADPVRKIVYWSVPAAEPGVWFAYSWALNQWSRVVQGARLLLLGRSRDITLDETYGSPDTTFDAGLAFDDPAYFGEAPVFYMFDSTNTLGSLTGSAMAATVGMGPLLLAGDSNKVALRRVRLDSDAVTGVTLTLNGKQRTGDADNITTHTGPTTSGDIIARRKARSLAPSFTIAAGTQWTFFNGFSPVMVAAGAR